MTDLPHDLITPEEAAQLAEISLPTLVRARRNAEIRNYRLTLGAKAVFYSRAEVRRWRDQRRAGQMRRAAAAGGTAA